LFPLCHQRISCDCSRESLQQQDNINVNQINSSEEQRVVCNSLSGLHTMKCGISSTAEFSKYPIIWEMIKIGDSYTVGIHIFMFWMILTKFAILFLWHWNKRHRFLFVYVYLVYPYAKVYERRNSETIAALNNVLPVRSASTMRCRVNHWIIFHGGTVLVHYAVFDRCSNSFICAVRILVTVLLFQYRITVVKVTVWNFKR